MSDMYFKSLPDKSTPLIPTNLDKLNDIKVSPTQPTTNEKVWIQRGNNILNLSNFKTQTINGVTFTNNNDGTITINGTANVSFGVNFVKVNIEAKQYSLANNVENGSFNLYLYDHATGTNILPAGQTATFSKNYDNVYLDT